ncbi:MAG TPA: CDP-diacylglycerol--glycerol-3-phosphate 3-phosphatidyltransferase [Acidiferrobacteraceae bacterium]|nr:CDP-diacylglycerol--glycerol-3-phosphate 3-phosphatidyltransferase [Acidiferrobacteraceae bacterium]
MVLNIPNLLTLLRIVLIPVFVFAYYSDFPSAHLVATGVFVLGALTDWLDGYLARRLNQHSALGAFLDPVADKLMVATALILLVADTELSAIVFDNRLFTVTVAIIVGREITVSALREWMAELGHRGTVAVSYVGKMKTIGQMVAISFLVFREPLYGVPIVFIGEILLYAAAIITLWSMVNYLKAAWSKLTTPDT